MKRLFDIVYLLLDRQCVTAGELAERLEVSVRTIYRDIEALSAAGVPVYMSRGKGGGIRLLDGFVLDKTVLSEHEQKQILSALQSLKAIRDPDAGPVLARLGALFGQRDANWVDVDFSRWGSRHDERFAKIKTAVVHRRVIEFDYVNSEGKVTTRRAEPLQLWFKNRAWYVKAYCLEKEEFRVFKISRMRGLRVTDRRFDRTWTPDSFPDPQPPASVPMVELTLRLSPAAAHRVYDEFGESDIVRHEDGSFTVKAVYPEDEWVYGYILSFGETAEVLEPERVRDSLKEKLREMAAKYG